MKNKHRARLLALASAGFGVWICSSSAWAKGYKSGEFETRHQYGFGAFEARIRAAQGPGVISTFFLWRPGSETAPAVPWHEIDFEMGQASGDYQTQIMTPGASPPLFRQEHARAHALPSRAWQAYYTYRIEWTPDYIAFFVDGREVRRETSQSEFASLFNKDASGDTPVNERMELRTGVWPGGPNITAWSGAFDGSTVPTGHFVDYVKVWDYTPGQANPFTTLLLDEEFNTLNGANWYPAQWTFDFSVSDYISQNIGARDGRLVVALTTDASQGILPAPPPDVPYVPPVPTVRDGVVIQAESYDAFSDSSKGNFGDRACSSTDVDAQFTTDPKGGRCNIGWTERAEWLEYKIQLDKSDEYEVTVRLASLASSTRLHLEVDGFNVSGSINGPALGYQTFADAVVPGVFLSAGAHVMRLVFDTGQINVNYLAFTSVISANCLMSCDDGNACTTDSCDPVQGCQFLNNDSVCSDDGNACTNDVCSAGACTHPNNSASCADDSNACTNDVCSAGACTHPSNSASCADDGNACTNDVCSAGTCTHPSNGTCTPTAAPCAGLCANPLTFTNANFSSGDLGLGAVCYQTSATLHGGVCGNLAAGRTLRVNGTALTCAGNWPSPLPAKRNGGYCVQANAGGFPWAYFVTW